MLNTYPELFGTLLINNFRWGLQSFCKFGFIMASKDEKVFHEAVICVWRTRKTLLPSWWLPTYARDRHWQKEKKKKEKKEEKKKTFIKFQAKNLPAIQERIIVRAKSMQFSSRNLTISLKLVRQFSIAIAINCQMVASIKRVEG